MCRVTQSISQEVSLLSLTHIFISYVFGYQKPIHSKLPPNREKEVVINAYYSSQAGTHKQKKDYKTHRLIPLFHALAYLLPLDSTFKHSGISCGQNLCIFEDFCNFQFADKYSGPKNWIFIRADSIMSSFLFFLILPHSQ